MSDTVLVTGGFGLVGSETVRRLAADGRRVVAADLETPANIKALKKLPDRAEYRTDFGARPPRVVTRVALRGGAVHSCPHVRYHRHHPSARQSTHPDPGELLVLFDAAVAALASGIDAAAVVRAAEHLEVADRLLAAFLVSLT